MEVPDKAAVEAFRLRYRLMILERLILVNALTAPVLSRRLPIRDSAQELLSWLEANSSMHDQVYGEFLKDPALTALYTEEAREVVKDLKNEIANLASQAQRHLDESKSPKT